ncbi:MAG: CDP-diacylglycerol--serine O-phosphatidyltransferase [Planctomycetota bacterium]|nr:MAG: CDP-diacylglycerol--serine O-phosphatidyltransferase [Planctomycetota bacterium]
MKRRRMYAVLPTLLTLGNGVCGFGSLTFAAKVGPEPIDADTHILLMVSATLIFLGMLFDMLDGTAARLTRQTSDFGAQLDSLCDAVTFGVAPAFLMLQFCRRFHSRLLWVVAAWYMLCTLLRLARFNVETDEDDSHEWFRGLPSPAAAGTVASFPLALRAVDDVVQALTGTDGSARVIFGRVIPDPSSWYPTVLEVTLPFVTFAVASLMVSRFRYPHVFNQWLRRRRSRKDILQLVFAIVVVYIFKEIAMPLLLLGFALKTPLMTAFRRCTRSKRDGRSAGMQESRNASAAARGQPPPQQTIAGPSGSTAGPRDARATTGD